MSIPLFLPVHSYHPGLSLKNPLTLIELCAAAGVRCRASGAWAERKVELLRGSNHQVIAEPGDWGAVQIKTNGRTATERARFALAVMAYSLHDLVAKESIKGEAWSRISPPRGRPKTGKALSTKERQRRFRAAHR